MRMILRDTQGLNDRDWRSDVRGQRSGVGGQISDVRGQWSVVRESVVQNPI